MTKSDPVVYLTMKEFEKIPKKRLVVEDFIQKPDYATIHHTHFFEGKQIFIKPEGRHTWT